MSSPTCLNCAATLDQPVNFCSHCGQPSNTHRLTIRHFIHESFHAVTHADKGIFHLLAGLATKPGTVAREYIAGRRKAYFNPFTFFLIVMGVFVLSNNYFTATPKRFKPDEKVLARIPTRQGQERYLTMSRRGAEVSAFTHKHGNVIAMFAVPFFALLSWLFYRRKGYNYAEHLTANLLFVTFSNIAFIIIVYPLQGLNRSNSSMGMFALALGFILQILYLTWCYSRFLPLNGRRVNPLGAFVLSISGVCLWILLTMTVTALYIYRSPAFLNFFTRMF